PDCLISASMDLHGNISARFVAAIDMLTAYRTAPHVDVLETREKACRMLM
ncbi:MAG: M81 family metallopeptidase, partial [Anaerolineales bacterium]|nr:M81 family metallopeptidase [Anaerolineales bacterium]